MAGAKMKTPVQAPVEQIVARWQKFCAWQQALAEYRKALEAERDAERAVIREPDSTSNRRT
jgi:ABC-type protease/lipase transport system fused ATPase/permease subunit